MKATVPIDDHHASLLLHSSFSTLADAERFIEWYDESQHHSAWDDTRFEEAQMLFELRKRKPTMTNAGEVTTAIERDPAYSMWEAERDALQIRQATLSIEIEKYNEAAERQAYSAAEAEAYTEEYCLEQKAAIKEKRESLQKERKEIRARLELIKPYVKQEKAERRQQACALHRERKSLGYADRDDYRDKLFGYLERIATAVEKMAGTTKKRKVKLNGRSR